MMIIRTALALLSALSFYAQPPPWASWAASTTPRCGDVYFTLAATAANRVADHPPGDLFSDPAAVDAFLGQPVAYWNVSGTFRLYGQLCRPARWWPRRAAPPRLQLLVHGSTYNHTYWSALREPDDGEDDDHGALSWVRAATRRGYWTLAIDRLGQGRSSRPDPVAAVQDPLQTELLHLLVRRIRDDDALGIGFRPKNREGSGDGAGGTLIYVGHSFGSGLGVHLAAAHPDDVDGLVLTGIATVRGNPQPGSFLARWAPAAAAFPDRFPRDLPRGYLASTNRTGREGLYWGPRNTFDAALLERDWAGQGTHPLGEVLTVGEYLARPAGEFRRPVLVADGDADAIFCSELGSRDLGPVGCRPGADGEVGRARTWFPGVPAELFATYLQPDAGHDHLLHRTGDQLISHAHEWMASVGL
ncbi:alpha/beta-hydrolase [Xylaria palmicola]|nr:alpha/beta-hydrolase [Xylaria palmicola]